ncbi:MAG: MATE family efflux transporter [Ignavibacteriales bacterium]|nr:MAG: MATE family efflux transporter [Ignavibacteriales bacterium]
MLIFILHGINFISLMLLVPLSIDYLGEVKYGIWVTLSSVVMWINNFDFGIGNGLRNKLSESFAENDLVKAKRYISTAYSVFAKLVAGLILSFVIIAPFIDWTSVFNSPQSISNEVEETIFFVFITYSLLFFTKLISSVINADQKPALNSFLGVLGNVLTLLAIYALHKTTSSNLILLGVFSSLMPLIIFIIASIVLFRSIYKKVAPSIKSSDKHYTKDLVGLGLKFFVIQLSGVIMFASQNLIITQLLGPEQVTVYNVAYRYFYFIPLIFNVVLTPLWSAYTEAYTKNEMSWIINSIKKIHYVWFILSVIVVLMVIASDFVYNIWVGSEIKVPFLLSILMGIYVIIFNWNNIYAYFLNGIGKIKLQFYYSILIALLNIPVSILLVKYFDLDLSGVVISGCIFLGVGAIWAPVQYSKIINRKAKGIWNK